MASLTIDLPDSLLLTSGQSRDELVHEARLLLLAKWFEMGRVSSGVAAEVLGMPRIEFLLTVGKMGIPVIQLDEEELRRELADA